MREFRVQTERRSQLIDVTEQVQAALGELNGAAAALVYVPHTTAGVTINEHADPAVARDFEVALEKIVSADWPWQHVEEGEENAPTHIRAAFMGSDVLVPVRDGRLALGTWQGIFLCEFDGPRERSVYVTSAVLIEVSHLTKRYGSVLAVDDLSFRAEPGASPAFSARTGRARPPLCARSCRCSTRRAATRRSWAPLSGAHGSRPHGRRDPRGERVPPGAHGTQPSPHDRGGRRDRRRAGRRSARARRPDRGGEPAHEGLLARDEAAALARRRAARRPAGARARRAGERARSAGHPLVARLPPLARGRGAHGARLQPRPHRDGATRRRRRDHRQGPADQAGADGRRAGGRQRERDAGPLAGPRPARGRARSCRHRGPPGRR